MAAGLRVIPSGKALGAEVTGVDLSKPITEDVAAFITQAWHDNLVLLFRHQELEDEDLLKIAAALGGSQETGSRKYFEQAGHKVGSHKVNAVSGVSYISNLDENGKPFLKQKHSSGSSELYWHTDNSYVETPPRGSFLHSLQVPVNGGGDTSFVNQYLAYETLSDDMKARIKGLHIKQDNSKNTSGGERPSVKQPTTREEVGGPVHPIVRIHPFTGKRALYLGRRYKWPSSYVVELNDDESESLLDELWAHATQEKFKWTHSWKPKEALLWDNQCTMHHRTQADPTQPRVLHRTLIKGQAIIPG